MPIAGASSAPSPTLRPRGARRCRVVAAGAVAVVLGPLLLLGSPAAWAHPLGLPAFARVAATGVDEVTVVWNAAADDVAVLAGTLGIDVPADGTLTAGQDVELSRSRALEVALTDGIAVRQGGTPCPARVEVDSLVTTGATLRFRCADPVGRVTMGIRMLTDLDQRYRTLAIVGTTTGPERWMFTRSAPSRTFELDPGRADDILGIDPAAAAEEGAEGLAFGGSLPLEGRFVALIDATPTATAVALGLLLALGIGALHGLAPGHGKAIAAAYLVGDRGRPRDAVLLGAVVALMHTGSVLVLGIALYGATRRPATALLSAGLQIASGVLVAVLGTWVLLRRSRSHAHDDVGHDHVGHDHTPALGPDVSPLSWPGLVVLGAAGGILPSPSALLVLFTALAVGRVGYGLGLIGAFSVGLAMTVAAVGLAAVWGRDLVVSGARGAWAVRLVRWAPIVAAAGVTLLGLALAVRGLAALR